MNPDDAIHYITGNDPSKQRSGAKRDLSKLLGIPHQTVAGWVNPKRNLLRVIRILLGILCVLKARGILEEVIDEAENKYKIKTK